MVAIVGMIRAPHITRRIEIGSDNGAVSAGILEFLKAEINKKMAGHQCDNINQPLLHIKVITTEQVISSTSELSFFL